MEGTDEKNRTGWLSLFFDKGIGLVSPVLGCWRLSSRLLIVVFCLPALFLQGQEHLLIPFQNASLEGTPARSQTPGKWFHCGDAGQSPPDTQPSFFGHQPESHHGRTYVGMVARKDGSKESLGQHLKYELEAGHCYQVELYLARSDDYQSASQQNPTKVVSFTTPLHLNLFAGQTYCDDWVLLGSTPAVTHTEWKSYLFQFYCDKPIWNLIFQPEYNRDSTVYYNGNILLDDLMPILAIDCATKRPKIDLDSIPTAAIITDWVSFLDHKYPDIFAQPVLFFDRNHHLRFENKVAFELLEALKTQGDKKLVIQMNPSAPLRQRRALRNKILEIFFHKPQILVTNKKKDFRKMHWLYLNHEVKIGLVDI